MKSHLLHTTIAAVLVVGCGESQQSTPAPETKPVEPVAESAQTEPPTAKAPDISIHKAAKDGNIEAVKQRLNSGADVEARGLNGGAPLHFAALGGRKEIAELFLAKGANLNAKDDNGWTPLHHASRPDGKEVVELFLAKGADVNAQMDDDRTPLDWAISRKHPETADLLRKHGGKTEEELKAEWK